jgi:SAM-dependent methyltransferase
MKMEREKNTEVDEAWENRWRGAEKSQRLTPLGRWMFRAKKKALLKILADLKATQVLEVGCGLGYTGEVFQKAGWDYLGIDTSASAISFCRGRGLRVEQRDLLDVGEIYDLVVSDGLLEHFPDFGPYARRMMRISQRYVLLIQPNHESVPGKVLAFLSGIFRRRVNIYEYNFLISDFIRVFEENRFGLRRDLPVFGNVFRLLLFEKKPAS